MGQREAVIILLSLEILPTFAHVPIAPLPFKCPHSSPKTRTNVGTYCGRRETVIWPGKRTTQVDIYYGIRYAQPPTGSLRFRKPVPPTPKPDQIVNANTKPDACYQYIDTLFQNSAGARMWQPNTPMSEDCLFLNIWVPILPPAQKCTKDQKLPVMVWIFGGSFYSGSSVLDVYDGRFLSTRQDVVVVTLNYRLGPFGFLYLNNSWVPGNMGLWDQRLAIKWVKDHIDKFNGDPSRITLFGESAGAVGVSAHLISPWSHGFFTNAILQSGSVFSYWGVEAPKKQLIQSKRLVEMVGCGGRTGRDLHSCLQLKSPESFIEAQGHLIDPNVFFSIPFPPVLDGHFLPYRNSQNFAEMGHLKPSGAVMIGMNANEGSYFLLYTLVSNASFMENTETLPVATHEEYFKALHKVLDIEHDKRPDLMEPLAIYTDFEYRNYSEPDNAHTWTRMLEEISSDRGFKCPTIDFAQALVNRNRGPRNRLSLRGVTPRTYFYEFVHRTESLPWPKWTHTMHGYEIEYVFGIPFSPVFAENFYRFGDAERELSDRMMTYWANFARTGDPNILANGKNVASFEPPPNVSKEASSWGSSLSVDTSTCLPHHLPMWRWQEFDERTEAFLILDTERMTTGRHPRARQCLFWRRWFPIMLQQAERLSGICPPLT
ncbi:Acetylcholinesterase [Taenia solium]|eukprot:TsM_000001700 transcript=TsM_000001700 gene=TsM_000001700